MKKNTKHILFFSLFILLFLLFLLLAGYQCPLRFFLGIPCPFCGMTRAFLCVLEGDLAKSFCKINLYNGGLCHMPYDKAEQEQNSNDKSPMIDPFV